MMRVTPTPSNGHRSKCSNTLHFPSLLYGQTRGRGLWQLGKLSSANITNHLITLINYNLSNVCEYTCSIAALLHFINIHRI